MYNIVIYNGYNGVQQIPKLWATFWFKSWNESKP